MIKVLYFFSTGCMSCKLINHEINLLAKTYDVQRVNDKFDSKLMSKYNIEYLPTIIVLKDNEIQDKASGIKSVRKVIKRLSIK